MAASDHRVAACQTREQGDQEVEQVAVLGGGDRLNESLALLRRGPLAVLLTEMRAAVIDPAAGTESGRIGNLNPQSALRKKPTQ